MRSKRSLFPQEKAFSPFRSFEDWEPYQIGRATNALFYVKKLVLKAPNQEAITLTHVIISEEKVHGSFANHAEATGCYNETCGKASHAENLEVKISKTVDSKSHMEAFEKGFSECQKQWSSDQATRYAAPPITLLSGKNEQKPLLELERKLQELL